MEHWHKADVTVRFLGGIVDAPDPQADKAFAASLREDACEQGTVMAVPAVLR